MRSILKSLKDLFFPPLCVGCNARLLDTEEHLCYTCILSFPKTNFHLTPENRLEETLGGRIPFFRATAYTYFYQGGVMQKVVHEFKYNENKSLAEWMGNLYAKELRDTDWIQTIDYLVPVPLHPKRQHTRGYNQSEELCKGLSQILNIPIRTDIVSRQKNNQSQTHKNKEQRLENVKNIFHIAPNSVIEGKHILLVDDVITTGATIESITKELIDSKCDKVSILALAMAM